MDVQGAIISKRDIEYIMSVPQDLKDLLESGAHFGHQARRWNPRMKPFIYSQRDNVHIFDLTLTAQKLNEACDVIKKAVAEGKIVMFVGTKRQAKAIVKEEAMKVGAPYIAERWLGGTLTNWEEINKRTKKLISMKKAMESGEYDTYTKKERVLIKREIDRLERFLGGIEDMPRIPDIMFVVDTVKEKVAVDEANNKGVTVVGMVDSNGDPDVVNHVIPCNDDAVRSIKYVVSRISEAYAEGKAKNTKS